jgi:hypothetical protein
MEVTSHDTSCTTDSECVLVPSGQLCDGYTCSCASATVNASVQATFVQAYASVTPGTITCGCPASGTPRCLPGPSGGVCTLCPEPGWGGPIPAGCPTSSSGDDASDGDASFDATFSYGDGPSDGAASSDAAPSSGGDAADAD